MKKMLFLMLTMLFATLQTVEAQQYTEKDSVRVMELLAEAKRQKADTNWMVFFGRKLRGVPYVAKTLEINEEERLVVNLRKLDCTTLVENALALTLCIKNNQTNFKDYCRFLRLIRYRNGSVSYIDRLHYFTDWIEDNTRLGFVKERAFPKAMPTATQTLKIDYMSTHTDQYPMLVAHPKWVKEIAESERALTGKTYPYIPKNQIANNKIFRENIHDGDILAITTSKKGLDTSHIGIAVWHKDGLHLLNASMIHKKVVEEPMTLKQYMQKHPSQTGIRVIRVL
ncbi:MAG: DUF1460 domain-containing protein [Prevotella sp.]|nr:DUF1460 domain-containing protein [Prevotella sp.]